MQLKDILKGKRGRYVTKGVLFLYGIAPAHRALATQKKLAYLGFKCLDHPPTHRLFRCLKKQLKIRHISSDAEVIAAMET